MGAHDVITVFLGEHDTTTTADIQAVIDGDEDSFDVTGMFEAGGEVTIRFRLSEQDDDEDEPTTVKMRADQLVAGDITKSLHVITDVEHEAGGEVSVDYDDGKVEVYQPDTTIEILERP